MPHTDIDSALKEIKTPSSQLFTKLECNQCVRWTRPLSDYYIIIIIKTLLKQVIVTMSAAP